MWVVSLLRGYNGGYSTRVRVLFPKEKKMGYCPKADKIPFPSLGLVADYQRLYHK